VAVGDAAGGVHQPRPHERARRRERAHVRQQRARERLFLRQPRRNQGDEGVAKPARLRLEAERRSKQHEAADAAGRQGGENRRKRAAERMADEERLGTRRSARDFRDAFGNGAHVLVDPIARVVARGRHPFEQMDIQALAQAKPNRAHRRSQIPDVRSFDRRRDHKQRRHGGLIGIGAQAPVRSRGNDSVGALIGTEPIGRASVALGATPDVHPAELRQVQSGERAARGEDFALAPIRTLLGSFHRKSPVTDVSDLARHRRFRAAIGRSRRARPRILPPATPRPKRREAAPRRRARLNAQRRRAVLILFNSWRACGLQLDRPIVSRNSRDLPHAEVSR
jgi:hypothetical protein